MKVRIGSVHDLQQGELRRIVVNGVPVCLAAAPDGNIYAFSDVCSHEEAPLSEGELLGFEVECPLHVSRFDVRTGTAVAPPATRPISTYRITAEEGDTFLEDDT